MFVTKADFRIFCFELETVLNKLVKLCSSFFQKNDFEQNSVFCFIKKVNLVSSNRNTGKRCEACSKLTIKTQKRRRHFAVFIVNFEKSRPEDLQHY